MKRDSEQPSYMSDMLRLNNIHIKIRDTGPRRAPRSPWKTAMLGLPFARINKQHKTMGNHAIRMVVVINIFL